MHIAEKPVYILLHLHRRNLSFDRIVYMVGIAMAIHQSIANRFVSVAKRVGVKDAVVFAGSCARNRCLQKIFAEKLQQPIEIADNPNILSTYGPALMARESQARSSS